MKKRWATLVLRSAFFAAVIVAPATSPAQPPKPSVEPTAPKLSADQTEKNIALFDMVWTTIRDTHFDPGLGGVDWNAVRAEFRPRVAKAATLDDARLAMTLAIKRLGQSHFAIIPSEAYKSLQNPSAGPGETGLDLRIIGGQAVVAGVLDDSPAADAKIATGWIVEKIGNATTAEILRAVEKAYAGSDMLRSYKALVVQSRLSGPIGQTVAIDVLDAQDRPRHIDLKLASPHGVVSTFGNLPPLSVRFVSKRLDKSIGYVSLNIFLDAVRVLELFGKAMNEHADSEGLVLDLRGNPGGVGAMAIGLGGWLASGDDEQKLGTMITRDSSLHFSLNPRSGAFTGPVAILVDEMSMSTSEILAGGLKDLGRARVFGVKTPGAALPSRLEMLPNGDRFQHAFANYISTGGKPLEGVGVAPDEPIELDRASLLAGRDPVIDAAIHWIRQKTPRTKS